MSNAPAFHSYLQRTKRTKTDEHKEKGKILKMLDLNPTPEHKNTKKGAFQNKNQSRIKPLKIFTNFQNPFFFAPSYWVYLNRHETF